MSERVSGRGACLVKEEHETREESEGVDKQTKNNYNNEDHTAEIKSKWLMMMMTRGNTKFIL